MKKISSQIFIVTLLLSLVGQSATATLATPTLGVGQGQVSVRLGTVNGQPGTYNTQFVVGGNLYRFPAAGQEQPGDFVFTAASYSVDSNPHTLAVYNGARPNSIGGSGILNFFQPDSNRYADHTFTPPAGSVGIVACWTVTFQASPNVILTVCSNNSSGGAPIGISGQSTAPIKYSGPEFSELALKPALAGSSATLEGRKLDQISSVTIGGKAAVLSNATDKSVNIGLPAGLTPGVYDLVVTTANHGKLTHMNAIRIREVLPATSLTIQGTGVLSGEEFKKLTAFSRTQNPDMNSVTCIVNSNSEGKSFMQARALCDRIAATNLNVKTTQFETRSTVKSSAIFARVVFNSEQ